jgi:predicted nucleic acid-binding protein
VKPAIFLDSNVLLYSISDEASDVGKKERALALLDRDDAALSVQVLTEFYVQATRTTKRHCLSHEFAAALMRSWTRFPVQDNTVAIVNHALAIRAATRFSYWDSAIVAAACALGCTELMTEDLSSGQIVEGVRIVNPFR